MKKEKGRSQQKAQGIVEYVLLVAAVIVLMLVVFRPNGPFANVLQGVFQQQGDDMLDTARGTF